MLMQWKLLRPRSKRIRCFGIYANNRNGVQSEVNTRLKWFIVLWEDYGGLLFALWIIRRMSQLVSCKYKMSAYNNSGAVVLPTRRRSNSAIISWAAKVQPGSPPPRSPRRRPSTSSSRRPSICSRRPSISTPSPKDSLKFDLTQIGYSSVFVHFPITPSTPSPFLRQTTDAHIPVPPVPASPKAPRVLKHFRSLSALTRSRSKSVSASVPVPPMPPMPPMPTTTLPTPNPTKKPQFPAVPVIAKRKKTTDYQKNIPRRAPAPPAPMPLANELALMQLLGGGSIESHAKRVMAQQAKAAGPGVGVGEVYRDEKGGVWWDEEEEWEYKGLLDGDGEGPDAWVQFHGENKENNDMEGLAGDSEARRGSVSTQDSDLDVRYLVKPVEDEGMADYFPLPRRTGKNLLALPARPHRLAKHLNKPGLLLVDDAFSVSSPTSPKFKRLDDGKKDFFEASFVPAPLTAPVSSQQTLLAPPPSVFPPSLVSPSVSSFRVPRARRMSAASAMTSGGKARGLKGFFRRRD
ncbi:hypothetical protein R3P38DRAFT_3376841 [Favolaschia claudopus]|uniref:Uncharacterized protein n=1 Tax=Favolaschia claudopus TaxID=2862362 RepID=A0AAV9ZDM6_9AGAR